MPIIGRPPSIIYSGKYLLRFTHVILLLFITQPILDRIRKTLLQQGGCYGIDTAEQQTMIQLWSTSSHKRQQPRIRNSERWDPRVMSIYIVKLNHIQYYV